MTDVGIDSVAASYGVAACLAMWSARWQSAACSADDVLTELAEFATTHVVAQGDSSPDSGPVTDLLALLRSDQPPLMVLPAPGDTFGLPGRVIGSTDEPAEVVVIAHRDRGPLMLVAGRSDRHTVAWRVSAIDRWPTVPDESVAELEYQLREAITTVAALIADLGHVRSDDADPHRRIRYWESVAGRLRCPPGADERSERLLVQAAGVDAIVRTARELNVGAGLSAGHHDSADRGLRDLATTVRRARMAAVNRITTAQR